MFCIVLFLIARDKQTTLCAHTHTNTYKVETINSTQGFIFRSIYKKKRFLKTIRQCRRLMKRNGKECVKYRSESKESENRKCQVEQRQTIKKNYCFSDLLGHLNPFLTFPFNSSSGLFLIVCSVVHSLSLSPSCCLPISNPSLLERFLWLILFQHSFFSTVSVSFSFSYEIVATIFLFSCSFVRLVRQCIVKCTHSIHQLCSVHSKQATFIRISANDTIRNCIMHLN